MKDYFSEKLTLVTELIDQGLDALRTSQIYQLLGGEPLPPDFFEGLRNPNAQSGAFQEGLFTSSEHQR